MARSDSIEFFARSDRYQAGQLGLQVDEVAVDDDGQPYAGTAQRPALTVASPAPTRQLLPTLGYTGIAVPDESIRPTRATLLASARTITWADARSVKGPDALIVTIYFQD